ncbi:MAG: ABC-2 family transporter protein [Acidimicrobiales bacterium]|nr:ABC-2 family transporter protein [Acidimicrobiales bacterium]
MRLYAEVAKRSFRRWSTYRAATIAGIFTNTIFGFIRAAVLIAIVEAKPGIGGLDAQGYVTFSVMSQALMSYVGFFGDGEEIGERIKTGDIVSDLYRPADFQLWWLAADVGRAIFQLIGRGVPIALLGALAYGLQVPTSIGTVLLFVVSLVGALLIGFGVRFLVQLSGFWLLDTRGTRQLVDTMTMFASGVMVPLMLFPEWLEPIARATPFAGMIQTPVDVFLGTVTGADALGAVAVQFGWAVALLVGGRAVMLSATRRVVIQGG